MGGNDDHYIKWNKLQSKKRNMSGITCGVWILHIYSCHANGMKEQSGLCEERIGLKQGWGITREDSRIK